ncbi:hypothetical protein [Trichothermofontia sp.]
MTVAQQPSVTFLALAYPPSPAPATEHVVHSLATALGHQGWQVHWVTTPLASGRFLQGFAKGDSPRTLASQETRRERELAPLAPTCQLVPIGLDTSVLDTGVLDTSVGEPLPERSLKQAAQAILAQQSQRGLISPLFHSFDDASALIGQYFKKCYNWRWLHTPPKKREESGQNRMGTVRAWQCTGPEPDQWLLWQDMATDTPHEVTDEVNRQRQRHYGLSPKSSDRWQAIATHLSNIYRQHLAAYVGASDLEIPPVLTLPALPERLALPPQKREPILANA